jgi:tetratricopeptide (TPR) repeat protein
MAGDQVRSATNCPSCGTKVRVDCDRCPKCRTWLVDPDPAAAVRRRHHLARWSVGLLGGFLVIVGGLWLTGDSEAPAAASTVRPSDPLAARRQRAASGQAAPTEPEERSFMDSSAVAVTAYSAGDFTSALQGFQAAIEKNPHDAESLSNLGQVLVWLGRTEEALPYFERAIALIPDRWAYHFNRARALGLVGRWDEAIAGYRHAQLLFPGDYGTAFNLALALHKKGDDEAAVGEYQKAIALAPEDASFRFALALSYERLQKNADASAAYGEYLRLAPNAPDAERVRARIAQLTGAATDPG